MDALLGTGLQGEVKDPLYSVIQSINKTQAKIIAVDIPSGLDCDTGNPLGIAIQATYTYTFACLKKGFMEAEAKFYLGEVHLVEIGIPRILLET